MPEMLMTERLRIYPASRETMERLVAGERDEEEKAAYAQMLSESLAHPEEREWYAAWMIERHDGTPVGDLCFKGLRPDGSVEIGYGIAEEHKGKGYATEAAAAAAAAAAAWALAQPGVKQVEAETTPGNAASQRVLAKCGFVPAGVDGEEGHRFVLRRAGTADGGA